MRSAEAGTVPGTLAYRRPCAQHHALCPCTRTACDSCAPARSLRGRAWKYPAIAGRDCLRQRPMLCPWGARAFTLASPLRRKP